MTISDPHQRKLRQLEDELEAMTVALTHAWDQLVPFLQEVPAELQIPSNLVPILQALAAAADTEYAGAYLFQPGDWMAVPEVVLSADSLRQLGGRDSQIVLELVTLSGQRMHWAFAPIIAEDEPLGVLGIGTDQLERAFTAVDLRIVTRMAERVAGQFAAARLALSRQREALAARELQIASEIQQSIQPLAPPQTGYLQLSGYWRPARSVGGDAWGWVQQPDGRLSWFILDVAGKGLPAALAAMALYTAISMALRMRLPPAEALQVINAHVYDAYTRTDLMATTVILALNPEMGIVEVANAGHPPILVRQQTGWLPLPAAVPPLGVLPRVQAEPQVLALQPNDLILCYSDGFSEIEHANGLWGETGLIESIPSGAYDVEALLRHIVAVSERVGSAHDDQTLVIARYTGAYGD